MSARLLEVDRLAGDLNAGRIGRRQFLARGAALGLSASALSTLLAACGGAASGTGGGDLHLAPGNVVTLDPAFVEGEADIAAGIFEGLVAFKQGTYDIGNQLAEKIEQSDDGRQVSFALKQGVQFHHGYGEVTAEDVKFSFERIAGKTQPVVQSYWKDDWQALDHVEVTGKHSGVIHLTESYGPLFRTTLPVTPGWVISKKAYEELGPRKFKLHPVGTGKYQFKEVIPQQRSVLERFPGYSGASDEVYGSGKAAFDQLTFVYIGGNQTLWAAMKTGELSYIDGSQEDFDNLKGDKRFKGTEHQAAGLNVVALNVLLPELSDVNVRRAILKAIDRQAIFEAVYNGDGELGDAFLPPVLGFDDWHGDFDQDLDAAKDYMAKAGVDSLTIPLQYSPDTDNANMAELIQGDLSKIGIKVVLKPDINFQNPGPQLRKNGITQVSFGVIGPDPSQYFLWFTCDQVEQYNYAGWCDPRFTKLYADSIRETDQEQRGALFVEMQKMIYDAAIILPLTLQSSMGIANQDVVAGAWMPDGRPLYAAFEAL